ncbi:MAG: hypothetical protein M3Y84_14565 [Acidobacteriota bacterium]|nr:hypothetical protein [Acidobacteriota bacterium]
MTANHRRVAKAAFALVAIVVTGVIIAVLKMVGIATVIIIGIAAAGVLVLLAFKIRARRRTEVIFRFYVAAEDVLRAGDSRRYRFEMADVIKTGEKVVRMMPDPPPLSRFVLGALYNSIGDHNATVEQLGFAAEEEVLKESSHVSPSRQLRRYVKRLRQIERTPKRSAKINAAIAILERMQREQAARLLAQGQQQLKKIVEAYESEQSEQLSSPRKKPAISTSRSLDSISAPPPISEVLRDIYPEEQKAP